MRQSRALLLPLLLVALSPWNSHAAPEPASRTARENPNHELYVDGTSWDLGLELGRISWNDGSSLDFRASAGVLLAREPVFESIGLFYDQAPRLGKSAGALVSVTHSEQGSWLQLGALRDDTDRNGALIAAGWSVFGIEAQRRFASAAWDRTDWLLEAKIRIPVGIAAFLLRNR